MAMAVSISAASHPASFKLKILYATVSVHQGVCEFIKMQILSCA